MVDAYQAIQITDKVYWVGAIDWSIRNFHGYQTSRGTTYNAFLIMGDPVILIDTVKESFYPEMMARVASVVDPGRIKVIVSNHTEMDHSAGIPRLAHAIKPETIIASKNGVKALQDHFHWDRQVQVAADGEQRTFGSSQLRFFETRMLHWPDSMFTYFEEEGVLFSSDGFGMHLASTERFTDELDPSIWQHEMAKYYANILLPFSPMAAKLLARFSSLNLDLRVLAPDHGPLWRKDFAQVFSLYNRWATQQPTDKAVVLYDSMWNSTARMAQAVGEGLLAAGARVKLLPLGVTHRSTVASELLDAGALLVGSPTLNNQMYPSLADAMTYLKGLRPQNLIGAAFGSYGWSGEAVRQLEQLLADMGIEKVAEGQRVKYVPGAEQLAQSRELGFQVGSKLKEKLAG